MNLPRSRNLGRWLLVTAMLLTTWSVHAGLEEGLTAYRNKNDQTALNEMLALGEFGKRPRAECHSFALEQAGWGMKLQEKTIRELRNMLATAN